MVGSLRVHLGRPSGDQVLLGRLGLGERFTAEESLGVGMDAGQGFWDLPAFEMLQGDLEMEELWPEAEISS